MLSETRDERASQTKRRPFDRAKIELERTPVLRDIFHGYAAKCGELLGEWLTSPIVCEFSGMRSESLRELIAERQSGLCALYHAQGWDAKIIIGLDRRFVFGLIDAMFGSDGAEPPHNSSRPFSSLEIEASKVLLDASASELANFFSRVQTISFAHQKLEPKLEFRTMGIADMPAVIATVSAVNGIGGGQLFIIVPEHALLPVREALERERPTSQSPTDPEWERRMISEISLADVNLTLSMEGPTLTLLEIAQLNVGEIVRLPVRIDSLHDLSSDTEPLFRGRLGQTNGLFSIQIFERFDDSDAHDNSSRT